MQHAPCPQPSALSHHTTNKETIENLLDKNCLIIYRAIIFRRTENTKNKGYKKGKKKVKKLLSLIVLSLFMMTGLAWAQANESFTNLAGDLGNHGQYLSRSWTGDDGVTWTAEGVRLDEALNGLAICFGQSKHNPRTLTSPIYSGGMGTLKFNYVRGFTGADGRKLEVYVNDQKIGNDIIVDTSSDNVETYNEIINIEGDVVLEIRSTGTAQVIIDDIEWTGYEASDPNQPSLTVNPTSLSGFGYEMGSPESQSQQFRVLSVNIDKNIVITAPDNYQLSLNSIFNNPQSVINARINDGSGTFYVRLEPGLPVGPYNGNITVAPENPVDGISTVNVSLSGEVTEVIPEVTLDKTSLSGFTYTENHGPSEDMSFTVKGKGIQTHIAVTLGSGNNSPFELRIEDEQNYESDLTLQNVETYTIDTKIYVRLKEGLSTGPHSDTIGFTCSDVSGSIPSIALSGVVYRDIGPDDYFVHFDDNTKIGYASGEVILSGKEWNMTEALTCTSKLIDGTNSARLSGRTGSKIEMNEPIDSGIGKISFEYRAWASDEQAEWVVQYKTTSSDWLEIGTFEATKDDNNVYLFEKTVDVSGEILIRVIVSSGASNALKRINIDNLHVTSCFDYAFGIDNIIANFGTIKLSQGNANTNTSSTEMPPLPNQNIAVGDYESLALELIGDGSWTIVIEPDSNIEFCAYNWQKQWQLVEKSGGQFEFTVSKQRSDNDLFIVLSG